MAEPLPVDARPEWLKNIQAEGASIQTLVVDGSEHFYTITRSGLAEGLPYTVGFPDSTSLMISENVKPEWRPFILSHEVREKTRLTDLPEEERCIASLKEELADAESELGPEFFEYVSDRRNFFEAIVNFYNNNPDQLKSVNADFINGLVSTYQYLNGFVLNF